MNQAFASVLGMILSLPLTKTSEITFYEKKVCAEMSLKVDWCHATMG